MFKHHQINLEPGFQRKSVWSPSDRSRLIQSIVAGYPMPSIFLYERQHNGRLIYDVIDGKQRLETIFMFVGAREFKRDRFDVKLDLEGKPLYYDWSGMKRYVPHSRADFDWHRLHRVDLQMSGCQQAAHARHGRKLLPAPSSRIPTQAQHRRSA